MRYLIRFLVVVLVFVFFSLLYSQISYYELEPVANKNIFGHMIEGKNDGYAHAQGYGEDRFIYARISATIIDDVGPEFPGLAYNEKTKYAECGATVVGPVCCYYTVTSGFDRHFNVFAKCHVWTEIPSDPQYWDIDWSGWFSVNE